MDKIREYTHLLHFKEKIPLFPDGDICITEGPDFIVHRKGSSDLVGIEHTEYLQDEKSDGTSLQAQDSYGQEVVNKAYSLYLTKNNKSAFVQFFFNPKVLIKRKRIDRLSTEIVHLIESTPIEIGKVIRLERTRENSENFPNEIKSLVIYFSPTGKENEWRCSSAGFIPPINSVRIQKILNNKDSKVESYKINCQTIWLLIVVDDFRIPSSLDYEKSAATHKYLTSFDRVFLFWNSSKYLIELNRIPLDFVIEHKNKS
jgi:hypothetical protein